MTIKKVIAIDLGGTNLRVSIVQGKKIIKTLKAHTPSTQNELLASMDDLISQLISKEIKGIGVGSPGPLENGVIKNPPNLPFHNFNLQNHLQKKFKKKAVIENDVHCSALGELTYGVKKKNFIVLAFGTGIGGGLIIDKKLYLGKNFAGELGHLVLKDGKFFEILWQETRKDIKVAFGVDHTIAELMKMNDPRAHIILQEMFEYIGMGIGTLINVFDPEVIVINGGFIEAGSPLLKQMQQSAKKYSILPHATSIEFSKLPSAGTLGASLLIA